MKFWLLAAVLRVGIVELLWRWQLHTPSLSSHNNQCRILSFLLAAAAFIVFLRSALSLVSATHQLQ